MKTSIVVYIYIISLPQFKYGLVKRKQRNYIQKKKKKDPVDRNRATFPCFLPFLFLRVRENVTCAEGSFALLSLHKVRASSFTLVRETRGSFDFIPRIRLLRIQLDSQWWQKRRETGREKKIRRTKVQLGVRFSRLPGDHAYTRARTHLSMHRWFIDQESTLFYCSNPLSLHQPLQQSASRVCRCFCRLYTNLLLFLSAISTSTRYQKGPGITRNLSFSPRHRSIGCLSHSPKNHSCSSHELN